MSEEKEIIRDRQKPLLPDYLQRFAVLYSKLGIPIGPKYTGNFSFNVDKLSKDVIDVIKERQHTYTVYEMTRVLVRDYNLYVRAEAVAEHYSQSKDTKFWQVSEKTEYIRRFEIENARKQLGKSCGPFFNRYQHLYKPFIVFLIENGYEYFQVASIIHRTPATIRIWANKWGYKEYVRVVTRQADHTGKTSRVDKGIKEQPVGQMSLFPDDEHLEVTPDKATHTLKVPRSAEPGEVKKQPFREHNAKDEMMLIVDFKNAIISPQAKERLNQGVTWHHVAMRMQNPKHTYKLIDGIRTYHFEQVRVDAYNRVVSLELVLTEVRQLDKTAN